MSSSPYKTLGDIQSAVLSDFKESREALEIICVSSKFNEAEIMFSKDVIYLYLRDIINNFTQKI